MLNVAGIDIGSVALSLAVVNTKGVVVHSSYKFHQGAISETMREMPPASPSRGDDDRRE